MKRIILILSSVIYLVACSGSGNSETPTLSEEQKQEVIELEEETTVIEGKIHEVEESEEELKKALENL